MEVLDGNLVPQALIAPISRPAARRARMAHGEQKRAEDAEAKRREYRHVALVSDELQNSLGAIRNAAHLMQLRQDDAALVERARLVIEHQTGEIARLVDDLLKPSRV